MDNAHTQAGNPHPSAIDHPPDATKAKDTERSFPILELPSELRLRVYYHVFASLPCSVESLSLRHIKALEPSALLQTCTIMRKEVNSEYFNFLIKLQTELEESKVQAGADYAHWLTKKEAIVEAHAGPDPEQLERDYAEHKFSVESKNRRRAWKNTLGDADTALAVVCLLMGRCGRRLLWTFGLVPDKEMVLVLQKKRRANPSYIWWT